MDKDNDKAIQNILELCNKHIGAPAFDALADIARIVQCHENELNGPPTSRCPVDGSIKVSKKPFDVDEVVDEVMKEFHVGFMSQKEAFAAAVRKGYDAAKNGR